MPIIRNGAFLHANVISRHTPWGVPAYVNAFAPGLAFYATDLGGGYRLSPERNRRVPRALRLTNRWYDQHCAFATVVLTWPELFPSYEIARAVRLVTRGTRDCRHARYHLNSATLGAWLRGQLS